MPDDDDYGYCYHTLDWENSIKFVQSHEHFEYRAYKARTGKYSKWHLQFSDKSSNNALIDYNEPLEIFMYGF